jgi:hypothetical protein
MHAPISLDLGEWYCLRLEPSRESVALKQATARGVQCYLPIMVSQRPLVLNLRQSPARLAAWGGLPVAVLGRLAWPPRSPHWWMTR